MTHPFSISIFLQEVLNHTFFDDTPIPPNTLLISPLCWGNFFSLPTHEFFRGQGKIKVGQERKK